MANCLQIVRCGLTPFRFGLPNHRSAAQTVLIRCRVQGNNEGGEERPESLFMKELKKRGMTPTTSLLEEEKKKKRGGVYEVVVEEEEEEEIEEDSRATNNNNKKKKNRVLFAEYDGKGGVVDQRERSMALNSEGLEGLIPRGKMLLTLGGTFFLTFWPLILVTIVLFASLYLYFGPSFVHDASKMQISPPPYVDPYALLEDERISQIAPRFK